MYGIILSSKLIIPNWTDLINGDEVEEDLAEEEEELPESPTWAPNTWKRAHWLYWMAASGRGLRFVAVIHTMPGVVSFPILSQFIRVETAMLRGGSGSRDDAPSRRWRPRGRISAGNAVDATLHTNHGRV